MHVFLPQLSSLVKFNACLSPQSLLCRLATNSHEDVFDICSTFLLILLVPLLQTDLLLLLLLQKFLQTSCKSSRMLGIMPTFAA
jgi:hypothetical protein